MLNKKVGDYVEKGEPLATIHSNRENINEIKERIYSNIFISNQKVEAPSLIKGIVAE